MARTRVIGLTGGIASGKSTVAALLARCGAEVIDADRIARQLVEPGMAALGEIVAAFGRDVLDEGGGLDRKRLAAIVFSDEEKRRRLNAILHPKIAAETARRVADANARGVPIVVYEAALIVENRLQALLDGLIVVALPEEEQRRRLCARDGIADAEAALRLAAQAPLRDKLAVADYVIENAGDLAQTELQVARVWREINAAAAPAP